MEEIPSQNFIIEKSDELWRANINYTILPHGGKEKILEENGFSEESEFFGLKKEKIAYFIKSFRLLRTR